MIKAIILDVDGVIVGESNPYPHSNVINKLKKIRRSGIFICLCTAKPHYSIEKIIQDAKLDNLHITDGGGVIIDPLTHNILQKHVIKKDNTVKVIEKYLSSNVYTEFYSVEHYFIQKNQKSELTKTHTLILQKEPVVVESLLDEVCKQDIVKIMPIAEDVMDKERLIQLFEPFENDLTLSWGVHPIALPHQFGIITAKGISKKQAVLEIAKSVDIFPEEMLGVGDSTSDWQFIEQCGYGAAMGNASDDLKKLVTTKGNKSFIGGSVDKNGVLDIFNHFSL